MLDCRHRSILRSLKLLLNYGQKMRNYKTAKIVQPQLAKYNKLHFSYIRPTEKLQSEMAEEAEELDK